MPKGMFLPEDEIKMQADELDLVINNEERYYKRKVEMFKNLYRKYRSGKFDPSKAPKLFSYLTDDVAREYNRKNAPEYFISPQARRLEDEDLVKEFISAVKHREYNFMG